MIAVLCPHCKWRYRTRTEGMGRAVECRHCGKPFTVGELRPAHSWNQPDLGLDSWIGVQPPDESAEEVKIQHCIMCDAPLRPGVMVCHDCGVNQLTGVKQSSTRRKPAPERAGVGPVLPVRAMLILLVITAIGAGGYWLIMKIAQSFVQTGAELAVASVINKARDQISDGGDYFDIAAEFDGQVTDENLDRFGRKLLAGSSVIREAVIDLIRCGNITDVRPLLNLEKQDPTNKEAIGPAWEAIGERRLVSLTCHDDESRRRAAVEALRHFVDAARMTPEVAAKLGEKTSLADKKMFYNGLGRYYPEAVGPFVVEIEGVRSSFQISVEQCGRTFYFTIGHRTFRSAPKQARALQIAMHRWCEATGDVIDADAVREMLDGEVKLTSPNGVGWRGDLRLDVRERPAGSLPGFLPFLTPQSGSRIDALIRFTRP